MSSTPSQAALPPRVSVAVPTYQRRHALPAFIEALLGQPDLYELVVCVDGATDGTVEYLEERRRTDPRLVVLDNPNRGVPAARQAGIEAATGDVVLLMDDDVIAAPGLVAGHARHHHDGKARLVTGYMPNDWRALPPGRRGIAKVYRRAYEGHVARLEDEPEIILKGLWGGNISMRREDFLQIGIDKLDVPRGQDDREFGIRAHQAGIGPVYDPALRARHQYDRDLGQFRRDCRVQGHSRKVIHEIHENLVGGELKNRTRGEVADAVGLGLPPALRRVLPRLARDPIFGVLTGLLTGVFHVGVRLRLLPVEVFAARGIGSLETMRGVLERP